MKRLAFLLGLVLICAAPVQAQIVCGGPMSCLAVAQTWTAQQTFSSPALFSDGSDSAPGIAFTAAPTVGIQRTALGFIALDNLVVGGASAHHVVADQAGAGFVEVISGGGFRWSSHATHILSGAPDLILTRETAATEQMGLDVNAAAVDQTIKAHDFITGADGSGASLNLKPGLGRGTPATPGESVVIWRDIAKATTVAQTYAPAWVACPTKILSTTTGTVQTLATLSTTTTSAGATEVFFTVTASDGTVVDSDAEMRMVAWNNNAGTVAITASAAYGAANSVVAPDTLAGAPSVTVATNVVSFKVTPAWTNTTPTLVTGYITFVLHSPVDSVVCQ